MATAELAWELTPLTAVLVFSGVLSAVLTVLVWRQRPRSGAEAVAAATITMTAWGFGQALLVGATGEWTGLAGVYLTLLGLSYIGSVWSVAALQYTGRGVSRRTLALLAVEPIVFLGLLATNTGHGLAFESVRQVGAVGFEYEIGTGTLVHYLFSYVLLAWANWLLFEKFLGSRNVYRKRTFVLMLVSVIPTSAHAVSVAGLSPLPDVSLGPVVFVGLGALSVLVIVSDRFLAALPVERLLALFGSQSKSLEPIARDAAIEQFAGGFFLLDHENRIVDVNQIGKRILGAGDARIVGKRVTDLVPKEMVIEGDASFLEPGATGEYKGIWVTTPDEGERCYDITITPLEADGARQGRIGLVHDVTERERRKQKLEARTAELERQNDQLENVASIVSHDLRNPLNVADGHLEMAENDEHVSTARRALERMEVIIEDVLTLATHGQTIKEFEPVDLASIANDAWNTVQTGNATLVVELDRRVEGDRSRLRQVFENLFRNSIEHGGVTVTVTIGPLEDGIYVEDTGPGIPEQERGEVFEEGYTTREEGTGIGLSIVETIVEAHGWNITVTTSDSGGARFEITGLESARKPGFRTPEQA
jgi:PAS domain S-box-containing protein